MRSERLRAQRHRIVIADDNLLFRRGLRGLLSTETDFEVLAEAGTEGELLVALERHTPDAAVVPDSFLRPTCLFVNAAASFDRPTPIVRLSTDDARLQEDGFFKAALTIRRDVISAKLVTELRNLLRPEVAAERQSSDLRALHAGSGAAAGAAAVTNVLTFREREVMRLLSDGITVREAAQELGLSAKTVEAHTLNLMRKLDIHNRSSLIEYAIAAGLADTRSAA